MFHSLPIDFLYSAYFITSTFSDCYGKDRTYSGTAFFLNSFDGQTPNLVTNRHIIEPKYKNAELAHLDLVHKHTAIRGYFQPRQFQKFLLQAKPDDWMFSKNRAEDVAMLRAPKVVKLNDYDATTPYGLSATLLATVADFESEMNICDLLAFPGYPPWYDRNGERPIIRSGSIASDPISDYMFESAQPARRMAYEAFSFGGSSGSPVFALARGIKTSGGISGGNLNAGHLDDRKDFDRQHSGISYLFKSTCIAELLDASA